MNTKKESKELSFDQIMRELMKEQVVLYEKYQRLLHSEHVRRGMRAAQLKLKK